MRAMRRRWVESPIISRLWHACRSRGTCLTRLLPIAPPAQLPIEPVLPAHLDTGPPEIAHLDFAPADVAAVEDAGHAKRRNRRVALTGLTSTAARVVQMGISLVTVPLTLKYLGAERFGLWMTMNAVLAMASFADFGIGSGLLNVVSEAFGQDDVAAIRRAVSSGFAVMGAIAAVLAGVFFLAYPFVDWAHFFGVTSPVASRDAAPAIAVFAVCFALNIALDVVQRVQLGLQQGYRYGAWQAVGSVLALGGVLVAIHLRVGLPVLLVAIAGGPVLAVGLNVLHFFGVVRRDLRPRWGLVSPGLVRRVARLGSMFFVLQLVSAVSFSGDNFILARVLGAASVPQYSIPQRLFAIINVVMMMLVAPLWPAYGEAMARGDIAWVSRTLRRSLLTVAAGTGVAAAALLVLAPWVLRWWVGPTIQASFAMLLGLAVWACFGAVGYAAETFMNAAGSVRVQVVVAAVFGVGCVGLKVFAVRRFGAVALPWATIVSYVLLSAVPIAVYVPRLLGRMRRSRVPLEWRAAR